MIAPVSIFLNLCFAAFLFYAAIKVRVRKEINVVSMNFIFLCNACSSLCNALFILFAVLNLKNFSWFFGSMMFFLATMGSVYVASNFLIALNTKNRTIISLFEILLISLSCFLIYMMKSEFSYDTSNGYSVVFPSIYPGAKFTWMHICFLVYGFLLPLGSLISCIVKIVREKELSERLFLGYVGIGIFFSSLAMIANIFFSVFDDGIRSYYNVLFPFSFVILAIILWVRPTDEKLTPSFIRYIAREFALVVLLMAFVCSIPYMFICIIPQKWRFVYFIFLAVLFTVILTSSWYFSKFLYGKYEEHEEFKRVGYRISEENQILQYLQYYTENIPSDKLESEYNIGSLNNSSDDILDFIKINLNSYLIVFGGIKNNTPDIRRNMLVLKSVYRTIYSSTPDLKIFVEKVNDYIFRNIPKKTEIGIFFAVVDFAESKISYVNGGIPFIGFYDVSKKEVSAIQGNACRLGENSDISSDIQVHTVNLEANDNLFICLDETATTENIMDTMFRYSGMELSMLELKYKGLKKI